MRARKLIKRLKNVPLFPVIPVVPIGIVVSNVWLAIANFRRLKRLETRMGQRALARSNSSRAGRVAAARA